MPEPVTNTQKLYVVFHGLIPLVEDEAAVHAILIEMSGHSVLVGHWLTEIPLPKSGAATLTLTGVRAGAAGIDPRQNLVVNLPELDLAKVCDAPDCYARIDFPKPEKLYSFFRAEASGRLTGTQAPELTTYSAVQVFEYAVPGGLEHVSISSGGKRVWKNGGYALAEDGTKISVLHIYNEPAGDVSDQHSAEEFLKGSELFGVNVGLAGGAPLPFPTEWLPDELPSGVLMQELTPLSARRWQVSEIVDAMRTNKQVPAGKPVAGDVFCGAIFIIIGIELWRRWFEHQNHP